jgi:tetratricopeptide (TPR) repeat protein
LLSQAQEMLGETEQALESIREAQRLHSEDYASNLKFQEAWIVHHAQRWDEALELYKQVIDDYKNDSKIVEKSRLGISGIYVEKGDQPQAEKYLEEVLEQNPDSVQANNDLGYLWADQNKNLERAEQMIAKAVAAEPDNPAYLDSLGWVYYRLGRYEQAVEYLRKATSQKHGDDGTIFDHLGDALEKTGQTTEAKETWKKALDVEIKKKSTNEKLLKSLKEKLKIE